MKPAEVKNLTAMLGKFVMVSFYSPDDDWPYYRLLEIDPDDSTIRLRGVDYPAHLGGHKHDGDEFWIDWEEVKDVSVRGTHR